jgi:hypothetical protein
LDRLLIANHRHHVPSGYIRRHKVSQQRRYGVLHQKHTGKAPAVDQRHVQMEDRLARDIPKAGGVDRLALIPRGLEGALGSGVAVLERHDGGGLFAGTVEV